MTDIISYLSELRYRYGLDEELAEQNQMRMDTIRP